MTPAEYGRYFQIDVDPLVRDREAGFWAFLSERFPLRSADGRYLLECASYAIERENLVEGFRPIVLTLRLAVMNGATIMDAYEQDVGWGSVPSMDLARKLKSDDLAADMARVLQRYERELPEVKARLDQATETPEPATLIHG